MLNESDNKILFLTQTEYIRREYATSFLPFKGITQDLAYRLLKNATFGAIPHLGAGILAAEAMSLGYKVDFREFYDSIAPQNIDQYSLVMASAMDIGIDKIKALATSLQDKHNFVVGGLGPTAICNELIEEFPNLTVVKGEGEGLIGQIITDFQTQGELASIYQRNQSVDLSQCANEPYIIDPSYRRLPLFKGAIMKPIEITRGCTQACYFCSTAGKPVTVKPLEIAKQEIDQIGLKRHDILFFIDQNLCGCPQDYSEELFDYINRKGYLWIGEGTIADYIGNEKLMNTMAKNCLSFLVGVEDFFNPVKGSPVKNDMQKDFVYLTHTLRKYKMPITYSIVFGTDEQTSDIFDKTAEMIMSLGITPLTHIATPRVGTPFFNQLQRDGRLFDLISEHRNMRDNIVYSPKNMSPQELLVNFGRFHKQIHHPRVIAERYINNLKDCGLRYATGLLIPDLVMWVSTLAPAAISLQKEGYKVQSQQYS